MTQSLTISSIISLVTCCIVMMCAMFACGASCHLWSTSSDGLGMTTVTEFSFRHAGIPCFWKHWTAYSATSSISLTISL